MGVYIKNMALPASCMNCIFFTRFQPGVIPVDSGSIQLGYMHQYSFCFITKSLYEDWSNVAVRAGNCPLVEVKDPNEILDGKNAETGNKDEKQ